MVPIIISILTPLLLYFLNRASKQNAVALADGGYELRMNVMYLVIGVIGIGVGLFSLFIPLLADEYSVEIFIATSFIFMLFMGLAIPCFLWYKNHRLSFNDVAITSKDAYGKIQRINWSDVNQVRFNSFTGVVDVLGKQGSIAKAHQHLVGFSSFIKVLQAQKSKHLFASESLPLKMLGLNNKTGYTQ